MLHNNIYYQVEKTMIHIMCITMFQNYLCMNCIYKLIYNFIQHIYY